MNLPGKNYIFAPKYTHKGNIAITVHDMGYLLTLLFSSGWFYRWFQFLLLVHFPLFAVDQLSALSRCFLHCACRRDMNDQVIQFASVENIFIHFNLALYLFLISMLLILSQNMYVCHNVFCVLHVIQRVCSNILTQIQSK